METINLWPQMWQVLYEHGASEKKREGTERYWNSLTAEQQREVFSSISTKLREGRFVQYDPIRALKENTPRMQAAEPTNWNGKALDTGKQYVTACWNGKWGTYTIEDARDFGMETRG